jgi:hypothetical protein
VKAPKKNPTKAASVMITKMSSVLIARLPFILMHDAQKARGLSKINGKLDKAAPSSGPPLLIEAFDKPR